MNPKPGEPVLCGNGLLRKGRRTITPVVKYIIHLSAPNGQASVVEFEPKPRAKDGDLVHLTLEDGRVVNCRILDNSPYCSVVGDGPVAERRRKVRVR